MSQNQQLKISGLYTSANELSAVPPGSLSVADNIEISQPGTAQPRRGFATYDNSAALSGEIAAITEFQSTMVAHRGTTSATADELEYAGTGQSMGSVTAPTDRRLKFAQQNQNLYMTSSTSPKVSASVTNSTLRTAGAYKGLNMAASTSATAATLGWSNGDQYAWRHVWKYVDQYQNVLFGTPSGREVFTATDATKGIDLVATIPSGVTTSWVLQIYRSLSVSAAVVAAGGEPSDEMYLAKEVSPNSTDISNGYLTVSDLTPDSLLGATLYTSSSQEGLAAGNEPPPFAEDLAVYSDCLFYGAVKTKYRYFLTLIGTDSGTGLVVNDTITISGVTFTAKLSETIASGEFLVTSTTTPANIATTAKSLVKVINRYASSTVYAYYISGVDDQPGKILIEERSVNGSQITVRTSKSTAWSPSDIPSATTFSYATADTSKSLIAYSKPNQPEHVPLTNYVRVGSKNDPILRTVSLREALLIFKNSGEVYSLSGVYPNFSIEKIADSVKLAAINSCAVLDDKVFCLTSTGVEAVDTGGSVNISTPIRQNLLELITQDYSGSLNTSSFGLAFQAEKKYYIFLPTALTETYSTQAFVFNSQSGAWVRHTLEGSCGAVSADNRIYIGDGNSAKVKRESRGYTFRDYADYNDLEVDVTAISGTTITIASGIDNVSVGDIMVQTGLFASITAVDPVTSSFTIDNDPGFSDLSQTYIYEGIPVVMEWVPETFGSPGLGKQFSSVSLLFKSDILGNASLSFATDLQEAYSSVTLQGRGLSQWGMFGWGEEPWGGEAVRRPLRQWVPRSAQRGSLLKVKFEQNWAYSNWSLMGIAVTGEFGSEAISRA